MTRLCEYKQPLGIVRTAQLLRLGGGRIAEKVNIRLTGVIPSCYNGVTTQERSIYGYAGIRSKKAVD